MRPRNRRHEGGRDLTWHRSGGDPASMASVTSVFGETVIVQVVGEVDTDGLRDWVDVLESAATLTSGPVLIDFGALESWTVSAQAVVVVVANRLAKEGRLLAICRLRPDLREPTTLPGVESVMAYGDVQQATVGLRLPQGWWETGVA